MMSKVTKEQVEHIAGLARLSLSDEEADTYTRNLEKMLEYVGQLDELNIEGVEPTTHVLDIQNVMREDETEQSLSQKEALKNAPETKNGQILVPPVLKKK
jgi:aspartyl-tRNA(Asn)/glutamyl-tRNA(Gln) amidotransferase subunit C